jgi:hypothetical protein
MLIARVLLLLILLPLCAFAPGFFFVRKFPWSPLEKLCGSVGLSLILLYLACFVFYWAGLPMKDAATPEGTGLFWSVSVVCLLLGGLAFSDAARLAASVQFRKTVFGFVFLLVWTLAILCMIRHYSGGRWWGDWLEHFQRSLFFLHHLARGTRFLGLFPLPSRPPMMNLLGTFFLAQAGDRFELFQITFTFLNLLVFLPCCLLMPALTGRRRRILPLLALLALNPLVMQNATYTWTKLLAAFYVVLAIAFYLAGLRKHDRLRIVAAFTALSAATLVHYSAGPYVVFMALDYLVFAFRKRPNRWRELAVIVAVSGALLATWFGWSIAVYGAKTTFTSNTSVQPLGNADHGLAKIAGNFADTVVPHPLRSNARLELFDQPTAAGWVRDYFFLIYQTNLIFAMGAAGGFTVLYLLCWAWWRGDHGRIASERKFWSMLVPFCLVLGVVVIGERDPLGQAHVTLQPLILLGVTLLAGYFASLPRGVSCLVIAGCALDFGLGIFLQARMESAENTLTDTVFAGFEVVKGKATLGLPQAHSLSKFAWGNWLLKHQYAVSDEWLAELRRLKPADAAGQQTVATLQAQFQRWRQEDALNWGGWYERHGGSLVFLGDHTSTSLAGGLGPPEVLTAVMFLVLIAALAREALGTGPRLVKERAARDSLAT